MLQRLGNRPRAGEASTERRRGRGMRGTRACCSCASRLAAAEASCAAPGGTRAARAVRNAGGAADAPPATWWRRDSRPTLSTLSLDADNCTAGAGPAVRNSCGHAINPVWNKLCCWCYYIYCPAARCTDAAR